MPSAKSKPECTHENVGVIPFDFGLCSESGYHDAGERTGCAERGEVLEVA